jgi:hypothetical protein
MEEDTLGNRFTEIYETGECQRVISREGQNFGGKSFVLKNKKE